MSRRCPDPMNPETLNRIAPFAAFAVFGLLFLWLAAVLRRRFLARYGKARLEAALGRERELHLGGAGGETNPAKLIREIAEVRRGKGR